MALRSFVAAAEHFSKSSTGKGGSEHSLWYGRSKSRARASSVAPLVETVIVAIGVKDLAMVCWQSIERDGEIVGETDTSGYLSTVKRRSKAFGGLLLDSLQPTANAISATS